MKGKKTLILTIIAVVTLLTVVGGATYAYFTFTSTISSGTNTITGTTGSVGTVTLTATTPSMHITTTANEFSQANQNTQYWSTATSGENYKTNASSIEIQRLRVTGGSSGIVYKCEYTLNLTTTGLPDSGVGSTDYIVYLKITSSGGSISIDMSTVANRNKNYTITMYLTGPSSRDLRSYAQLKNRNVAQNYLQGKTIETVFTASDLSCTIVETAGTDSITAASS